MSNLIFQQQGSSPSDAGSGYSQIYAKSDGKVYRQAGTDSEVEISGLAMADITSVSSLSGSNVAAKAWVNFDGTTNTGGNCTIHSSFNISTVADEGTGDYTINFATDMADDDFAPAGMANNHGYSAKVCENSRAAGNIRIMVGPYSGSAVDASRVSVIVFGN